MAIKVYIVYYSMYGHEERLAQEIKKGADSVEGVESTLWQVPETLSVEELDELKAPPKSDVPIITPNNLLEADGFVLGFPTRSGIMAAQFQAFLDSTGDIWKTFKPTGIFFSTGTQGGGQETTMLTATSQLRNHGSYFATMGYILRAAMSEKEEVKGGSPSDAGTNGSRDPNEIELAQAFYQGKYIASLTKNLMEAA